MRVILCLHHRPSIEEQTDEISVAFITGSVLNRRDENDPMEFRMTEHMVSDTTKGTFFSIS